MPGQCVSLDIFEFSDNLGIFQCRLIEMTKEFEGKISSETRETLAADFMRVYTIAENLFTQFSKELYDVECSTYQRKLAKIKGCIDVFAEKRPEPDRPLAKVTLFPEHFFSSCKAGRSTCNQWSVFSDLDWKGRQTWREVLGSNEHSHSYPSLPIK